MKRLLMAGLLTAGLFGFATTDANAYYYGGYYGGYYSRPYYPSYGYPGLSINFRYYDNDRYDRYRSYRHRHRHHDHWDHHDRYDRHHYRRYR